MQPEELIQLLSDNQKLLIFAGGVICFISLFLPFWSVGGVWYNNEGGTTMGSYEMPIFGTFIFWLYVILIFGVYYGDYHKYGVQYPYLFLSIGISLLLLTFYAYQHKPEGFIAISFSKILYGFYLEFIGSLAIAIGGHFAYVKNTNGPLLK